MDQAEVIGYLLDKSLQTVEMKRYSQRPMDLAVRQGIKQLLSIKIPKTHDVFKAETAAIGNKLQSRIRPDYLQANTPFSAANAEKAKVTSLEEEKKNGRLLNQAIIKYRIEKKKLVDSAYRIKLG